MFTQHVERVTNTRIFARAVDGTPDQMLAYRMSVAARSALAMVLPLPTPVAAPDDAMAFIDLSSYPRFFDDLDSAFPRPPVSRSAPLPAGLIGAAQLIVHEVGDYDASFVPTLDDFVRLDPRFRMSDDVWRRLPDCRDHGFAVFQLRPTHDGSDRVDGDVHPMAFRFPRRDPSTLFFPTVHVHDGTVPRKAVFDHTLYWQPATTDDGADPFDVADAEAVVRSVDLARAAGVVDGTLGCRRRRITGKHRNADTIVPAA